MHNHVSRSQALLGNAVREAPLRVLPHCGPRSRASRTCVPKLCLGTRGWGRYIALGSLSLVLVVGCGRTPALSPQTSIQPDEEKATPAVRIVRPERASIHREVSQPGTIEAFEETPMFAKVAGYVRKWNVDRGDFVKQDQVLAELWVPELEVTLREKEALVRQTEAEVKQAEEALAAAEAAFHSAEAKVPEFEAKYQAVQKRFIRAKSQADRLARMSTA